MNIINNYFNNKSGIYMILCISNGLWYFGSSKNILARNKEHISLLKNNKHHSPYLQNSYNKYGKENFRFCIMELCSIENLKEREQWYINYYKSANPKMGFNVRKTVNWNAGLESKQSVKDKIREKATGRIKSSSTIEKIKNNWKENWETNVSNSIQSRGKEFSIMSPDGTVHTTKGVRDFARKYQLDYAQLQRVLNKKSDSVKGWTLPDFNRKEPYRFISPFGQKFEVPFGQLRKFSIENKISNNRMSGVWSGNFIHHKGWCRLDKEKELFVRIKNDDGREVYICKKHYISHAKIMNMSRLALSKLMSRQKTKVKGWQIVEEFGLPIN